MDAIFLNLVNISITASYIAIAVILFRLLLKRAPKAYTCILWLLVALRLILPISDKSKFSFSSILSLIPNTEVLPNTLIDNTSPQFNINVGIDQIDRRVNAFLGNRYAEGVTVPTNAGSNLMNILGIIWIVVCVSIIIYAIGSFIYLCIKTRASVCIKKNTFICDYISTPFILGIIKPKILLPSTLNEEERRYVLAHERAHLKRLDYIWKPLGFILLSMHWFNPIMWISYILFCRDIELACDESVIKKMDNENKKAYSTVLLTCSVPKKLISTYPLAFGEIGVKERIKAVLKYKKPAVITSIIAIILCVVTAFCFLANPQKTSLKEMINDEIQNSISYIEIDNGKAESVTDDYKNLVYILNALDKIKTSRKPVLNTKTMDSSKSISMIYPKPPVYTYDINAEVYNSTEEYEALIFYFNDECNQVWIDESTNDFTYIYKINNPEKVLSLFENINNDLLIDAENYQKYVYTDSKNEFTQPRITLFEQNHSFQFMYSEFSSYLNWGHYEIKNDTLILRTHDGEYIYTFKIEENGIRFDEKNSSKIVILEAPIPDESFFEWVNK